MTSNVATQSDDYGATGGDYFFVPEMPENSNNVRTIIPSTMPIGKDH